MKNFLKKIAPSILLFLLGLPLFPTYIKAQEVVASEGGFVSITNILYSFTVGECFTSTLNNPSLLVTQGFQQPYQLTVEVQETWSPLQLQAFPNPTTDAVTVTYIGKMLHFSLYESTGRLFSTLVPNPSEQRIEISFSALPAGIYLLRAVSESGHILGFVRIIKQ